MEIRRTVPVKLDVSDAAAESLFDTIDTFRAAANYVVDHSRKENGYIETSKQRLHERTYQDVRSEWPELHANLVQAARSRAATALGNVVDRWKDGKSASLPEFTSPFLDYDKRSATFHDDHASLSTVDGRVRVEYVLPPGDMDETPYADSLFSEDYEVGGATLHYREPSNRWYLHVRTKAVIDDADHASAENQTVLGVDVGIENIAVTSTGRFWSGGLLNHRRDEYEHIRGSLQQTGTESAHWTIKSIGQRERRWNKNLLHCLSKGIVQEALAHDCGTISFERLKGIRWRMPGARKFHTWAFNQLYEYVEYKAEAFGIDVVQVPPQHTSQRCTNCGHTAKGNRPTENGQDEFCCLKCGYELHADYNAAKNIGWKHVQAGQKSPSGRANRQLALKSGTVNANGEFSPASDGQSGSPPASSVR
jgi:putative transposase